MDPKEESRRAVRLLEALVQMAGLTREELDHLLGAGRSYSSQLFTHRMSLKFERIIQILQALEVDPGLFFRVLYPDPSEPAAQQPLLERFLSRLQRNPPLPRAEPPPPQAPEVAEDDLDRRIQAKVEAALAARAKKG